MDIKEMKNNALDTLKGIKKYKKIIIIVACCIAAIIVLLIATTITINIIKQKKAQEYSLTDLKVEIDKLGYENIMLLETTEKTEVANMLGVNEKSIDKFIVKPGGMRNKAYMYMIIKPAKGKINEVKQKIDEYLENYDKLWKSYLPDQYVLVKNKAYGEKNGYIYVFITDNAYDVEDLFKSISNNYNLV